MSKVRDFPKSAGYLALLTARGTTSRFSQMHVLLALVVTLTHHTYINHKLGTIYIYIYKI
jgi:hypothetical protein